ncbi:peroxiredoxin, partial [Halobellus sp. Atlit-38R]
ENEKFGDRVLLSPPGTDADAEERKAEAEDDDELDYYDWWFVTKKR